MRLRLLSKLIVKWSKKQRQVNHLYLNIDRLAKFAAEFSFIFPAVLFVLFNHSRSKTFRIFLTAFYIVAILMVTILLRRVDVESRQIMAPFWSYRNMQIDGIRWQIYINICLFVPLGFMLPWSMKCSCLQTVVICAALSAIVESVQYAFGLGLCEFDDILNNTLGATIGFLYWYCLNRVACRIKTGEQKDIL